MNLYIYLSSPEFVKNWVEGGELPLKDVNYYLAQERKAEKTLDEGRFIDFDKDKDYSEVNSLLNSFIKIQDSSIEEFQGNISIKNFTIVDKKRNIHQQLNKYEKRNIKGLVLCMSTKKCKKIAGRFDRKYCVQITDFPKLKKSFDEQLGCIGISNKCKYTSKAFRNHFLKSKHDSWQSEFRVIWDDLDPANVIIPRGIAKEIKL